MPSLAAGQKRPGLPSSLPRAGHLLAATGLLLWPTLFTKTAASNQQLQLLLNAGSNMDPHHFIQSFDSIANRNLHMVQFDNHLAVRKE
ncbi:hypothetical protein CDAR_509631 [Caerostris darwini]|uniref:Uncharacterized protein n=1 Tax=Caerostris darwini TaxID=1538125 RepID=A0AAV4P0Q2_9ARAC|nr:hypothetical protein CDAR_509631 [Caerostris darwini]